MQPRKKMNQQGFTLIEIAIVLTIVGLVIGGIWLAASTVFNNNKQQTLSVDVIQIMQNTKSLFSGSQGTVTTGFTLANAIAAGVFPSGMVNGALVVQPFASNTAVSSVSVTVPSATTLAYTFGAGASAATGLPQSACTNLLTTLGSQNNMTKLGITSLLANVGGTAGSDLTTGGTVAVTPAAAAAACSNPATTDSVSVTFTPSA